MIWRHIHDTVCMYEMREGVGAGSCDSYGRRIDLYECEQKGNAVIPPSENTCVCCGEVIPEGRQVCAVCETKNTGEAIARGMIDGINSPCPYTIPPLNVGKKKDTPVDIHKIIDDAMEKRDRTVSIFISAENNAVSVNVYPVDHDKVYWIDDCRTLYPYCSNCGYKQKSREPATYCGGCGELMHGVKEKRYEET